MDIDYAALFGLNDAGEGAEGGEGAPGGAGTDGGGDDGAQVNLNPQQAQPAAANAQRGAGEPDNAGSNGGDDDGGSDPDAEGAPGGAGGDGGARGNLNPQQAQPAAANTQQRAGQQPAPQSMPQGGDLSAELLRAGLKDPYTGKPITTLEELRAYSQRAEAARAEESKRQRDEVRRRTGMTEAQFDEFISGLDEVRSARAERDAAAAREAERSRARLDADIKEQVAAINAINPAIKTLADLHTMDTYPQLYEHVKRGASILDAYRLANFDSLVAGGGKASANNAPRNADTAPEGAPAGDQAQQQIDAAAVRQSALNAQSKQHLNKTVQRGKGAMSVPADVAAQYRIFIPDLTDAEIQKHYNADLKR